MKRFHVSPSTVSIFCWSSAVPSVAVTSAWVSPRVNRQEPCVRGSTPTSIVIVADLVERAAVEALAALERLVAHDLLLQLLEDRLGVRLRRSTSSSGMLGDRAPSSTLSTVAVVLELVLDAHRVGERSVGLALRPRGRTPCAISFVATSVFFLPACFASASMPATISLIAACARLERLDHLLFRHFLRAGFDHHDAVLAAGDDQIEPAAACAARRSG